MRIALTHPFCWPHTRRGTERYLDVLARFLTSLGHEVTLVSSAPAPLDATTQEAGRRLLHRLRWAPWMSRIRIAEYHAFFVPCLLSLARLEVDVVHSFHFWDGYAATLLARAKGFRTVFQIHGPPVPEAFRYRVPPDRRVLARVLRRADRVVVPSAFVENIVRDRYGVESRVLQGTIELEPFEPELSAREGPPILLSVGNFAQRSKGGQVLVTAFALVKRTYPDARLRLSGNLPEGMRQELLGSVAKELAGDIEFLGLGRTEDLPRLYREATVMVLPSMWDAAPSVIFESWACGTPVVVTDHGGAPEYLTPGVGTLFDPGTEGDETHNAAGLAQAIVEGVALGRERDTPANCRAHAERHEIGRFADEILSLYHFD